VKRNVSRAWQREEAGWQSRANSGVYLGSRNADACHLLFSSCAFFTVSSIWFIPTSLMFNPLSFFRPYRHRLGMKRSTSSIQFSSLYPHSSHSASSNLNMTSSFSKFNYFYCHRAYLRFQQPSYGCLFLQFHRLGLRLACQGQSANLHSVLMDSLE
jgi:hypothetical protein